MFRENAIYVSRRTLKRLKWIRDAGLAPQIKNENPANFAQTKATLDQIGDHFLNAYIEEKFPGIVPAEKLYDKAHDSAEEQAIDTIKNTH